MITSNVAAKSASVNLVELQSAVWHALGKVAGKEADRDDLTAGRDYEIRLAVEAEIEGQTFRHAFDARLNVGHDSERAGNAPTADVLLAYVLGKLNTTTREALLRDMPSDFASHDGKLPVEEETKEAAKAALQRLRATKSVTVRGTVACEYAAAPIPATRRMAASAADRNGSSSTARRGRKAVG